MFPSREPTALNYLPHVQNQNSLPNRDNPCPDICGEENSWELGVSPTLSLQVEPDKALSKVLILAFPPQKAPGI